MKYLILNLSIIFSALHLAAEPLKLGSDYDKFFEGDPLNTWQQPEDPRYKNPDELKADPRKVDLLKFFKDPRSEGMRKELFELKNRYAKIYQSIENTPGADFILLSKQFTDDLMKWTAKYIKKAMPASVSLEDFAFISFGSMARKESGPVTDLESALVWDPKFLDTADKEKLTFTFANNISQSLQRLIGHPSFGIKGYRTDESGAFPFNLAPWAKNLSLGQAFCVAKNVLKQPKEDDSTAKFRKDYYFPFEGSWAYSTTPKTLASYTLYPWTPRSKRDEFLHNAVQSDVLTHKFIKDSLVNNHCVEEAKADTVAHDLYEFMWSREKQLVSLFSIMGRNRIFLVGNQKLFDDFERQRNEILDEYVDPQKTQTKRRALAFNLLKRLSDEFGSKSYGNSMFITGVLPSVLDIKRNIYRFDEQIFTNLGLYYKLRTQNIADIVKTLARAGIMGPKLALETHERMNALARLRWKSQLKLNTQLPNTPMDYMSLDAHAQGLGKLVNELASLESERSEKKGIDRIKLVLTISELKSKIDKVRKLEPLRSGSVLEQADIDLLRNTIMPAQAKMFRRVLAFMGYYDTAAKKDMPPNPKAFSDDFDTSSVNAR